MRHGKTVTTTWEHDAAGNRTKQIKGSTVTTYVYDTNDRLTKETTGTTVTTYSYSGTQLTQKSVKVGNGTPTNTSYSYNAQGGMNSVSGTAYKYDTEGILVSRGSTKYLNDKLNPTGYSQVFVEATGSTKKAFTCGHDLISQHSGSTLLTMLYDGLGSVRGVLNANGTIDGNVAFCYDAFGNTIGTAPTATDYRYAGERLDTTTGWYYLRQRYYDPKVGRFNRLDPFWGNASDPQSLHKYTYCHGDPVNHVDPSGMFLTAGIGFMGSMGSVMVGMFNQSRGAAANMLAYNRIVSSFQYLLDIVNLTHFTFSSMTAALTMLLAYGKHGQVYNIPMGGLDIKVTDHVSITISPIGVQIDSNPGNGNPPGMIKSHISITIDFSHFASARTLKGKPAISCDLYGNLFSGPMGLGLKGVYGEINAFLQWGKDFENSASSDYGMGTLFLKLGIYGKIDAHNLTDNWQSFCQNFELGVFASVGGEYKFSTAKEDRLKMGMWFDPVTYYVGMEPLYLLQ